MILSVCSQRIPGIMQYLQCGCLGIANKGVFNNLDSTIIIIGMQRANCGSPTLLKVPKSNENEYGPFCLHKPSAYLFESHMRTASPPPPPLPPPPPAVTFVSM